MATTEIRAIEDDVRGAVERLARALADPEVEIIVGLVRRPASTLVMRCRAAAFRLTLDPLELVAKDAEQRGRVLRNVKYVRQQNQYRDRQTTSI